MENILIALKEPALILAGISITGLFSILAMLIKGLRDVSQSLGKLAETQAGLSAIIHSCCTIARR